ncbi:MAG: TIGR02281 family clan AA aspartic protease [Erythrobacter sp.]|uniref:retropepsin-like aspartic protease family protein n=1 Tax=Erythrobacter sp. TaxID=1042 RepID=UPI0026094405|nr:TIGR02281 family clan AA aspartic protease [Erythrobacter sp.]MDJ0979287.1 TIGR02281 family clan AA aspartic protease [Erythrobacter sp.]
MLGRYAFFAIAICAFAVFAVPRADISDAVEAGSVNASAFKADSSEVSGAADTAGSHANWYGADHTLSRQGDGHFYASASVNGASVRMLVDTGASVIALTGDDAMAAGILWDQHEVSPVAQGASGAVYGVRTRLREVEIAGMRERNVEAIIVPEGLGVSLLGQSYLSRLSRVEISDDRMQLSAN